MAKYVTQYLPGLVLSSTTTKAGSFKIFSVKPGTCFVLIVGQSAFYFYDHLVTVTMTVTRLASNKEEVAGGGRDITRLPPNTYNKSGIQGDGDKVGPNKEEVAGGR